MKTKNLSFPDRMLAIIASKFYPKTSSLSFKFLLFYLLLSIPLQPAASNLKPSKDVDDLAGPVTNLSTMSMFATIQAAIDDAGTMDGDVIQVDAGSYTETLNINKSITLQGPNIGVPGSGARLPEAILLNCTIDFNASGDIVLDGFHVLRTDAVALDQIILDGAGSNTVQNCIFERNGAAVGTVARALTISAGGGIKNILNNKFTGDDSGGLFSGHKTWNNGIFVNGGAAIVVIMNNTIEKCRTALNFDDFNINTTFAGNTLDNNGTHISFGGTIPTTGSFVLGANDFINGVGTTIINLSNVDISFRLDITSSTLNGTSFSALTPAELFEVEARMAHKEVSGSKKGKVTYVANNQYVNNFTSPVVKIDKIQNSIKYGDPGDIINLQDGQYHEKVTVNVSNLTLQGITNDKFLYVLDGTGVMATRGIEILTGLTDISIKNLTVQNFAGVNGNVDAAIYAIGPNNDNLNIDNVALLNNASGSGFYANGPIDGFSLSNSMVANHGPGSRGIVVWNGFKQNISITNNMVTNNNCCGIELQDGSASAVDISHNTIDIGAGDNAIGVVGLDGSTGINTINTNVITGGGRFGIEVKNPAGDVTVDGNQLTFSGSSDVRDKGGIVVIRRAVLGSNVDIPNGVTVTNNTVTGYTQGSTSEGFGIVIEGTNHVVTNNTLNGNDIGIQQQAGHLPYPGDGDQSNVADTYFGRGNAQATCGNMISGNNFSGNGQDTRDVGISDGLVMNSNTGKSFCSIQAAIDDAETVNGHTILVGEGNYFENVYVHKSVTINGPNAGISPNTGSRIAEAIVYPATSEADAIFTIEADNVHINGLTLDGDNPNISTGWTGTNGSDIDVYDGIVYYDPANTLVVNNLSVISNIIKNVSYFGIDLFGWNNFNNPSTSGHLVDDNLFMDLGTYLSSGVVDYWGGAVLIYNDNYTRITNNVMTNVRIGVQTGNFHDMNPGDLQFQVIDNNQIQARRRGIFYNLHTGPNVESYTVSNNMIGGISDANESFWDGILMSSLSDAVGEVIGNIVDGTGISVPSEGLEVWNVNTNAPVHIMGGSVSNTDIGVFVNNYEGYVSNAGNTDCVIEQVDLTNNIETGIYVKDSPDNSNGSTVHALIKDNTSILTNDVSGVGILVEGADASANIEGNLSSIDGNDVGILVDEGVATITENSISGNNTGIKFQNGATGIVNKNNIAGNITFGVENTTGSSIDATLNWWGDATGPSGSATGAGDAISADVEFCPWLSEAYSVGSMVMTGPIMNVNTSDIYCSIQDAIDAASPMDVIEILIPNYIEPAQIVVSKAITLQGAGKTLTTLRPGFDTGSTGDARGFIFVESGIEFHLKDLTIDGTGQLVWQAIRSKGSGTIDNVAFSEIKYQEGSPSYAGTAVAAFGDGNTDITNCMFSEIGRVGVLYYGTGINGALFMNNMYTGKGVGDWLDYALDISAGAVVNVSNNTIASNLGVASSDGSTSAGILVTTYFALGTMATITENTLQNNTTGIAVGYDGLDESSVVANYNNMSGNGTGISSTNAQVDGTANWWGDASGPSGEGPGTGDAVSTHVDFCGWLIAEYDGSPDPTDAGIPDPEPITTIQACSGEPFSFDLDDLMNNPTAAELGQVTYVYNVTVVPDVNVLVPDPRATNVASSDGAIMNTITNYGSQSLKVVYTVTPTSQYGCVGPSFTVEVVINLNPQVDIIPGSPSRYCPNTTHLISGTVVPGATYSFQWEILQDPSALGSSISPANTQSTNLHIGEDAIDGTLQVRLRATNLATGCVGEKIYDLAVNCTDFPPCQDTIEIPAPYFNMDPHQMSFHAGKRLTAEGLITSSNMEKINFKAG
ncbi:MAG: hypothetical protein KDC53_02015, partial [Saprospiraceae bacterium]|nr:hypothetical protein [Saprospiraceae bacterium]